MPALILGIAIGIMIGVSLLGLSLAWLRQIERHPPDGKYRVKGE